MVEMNSISEKISNKLWKFIFFRHTLKWKDFDGADANPPKDHEMNHLERIFWNNTDRAIDKWHHYFGIYDKFLQNRRNGPLRLLEIGVQSGGSLRMWRDYFGQEAILFGIDIDPRCATFDGDHGKIRIGSQDDPIFLRRVIEEMGGVDIVIDDGSHHSRHLRVSFETLFPLLSEGGIYIAEDLHCCYWPDWNGGFQRHKSFLEYAKSLVDDMHHWYHGQGQRHEAVQNILAALHFYDSMIVFEKRRVTKPVCSSRGIDRLY